MTHSFNSRISSSLIAATLVLGACVTDTTLAEAEAPAADPAEQVEPETTVTAGEADQSQATLETAQSFLWAAGSGDMETLTTLMTDDFVWHNEGDTSVPWVGGPWVGKDVVLNEFLPKFGAGLTATSWTTDYSFANGDQAVFMGTMNATANNTGAETGVFSWAVRVHVEDGKVKSWNWFEDSYAISKAYNGKPIGD